MRCQSIRLAASSTGSSSATVTRSVVINCSMDTKLWRHAPPSSSVAGVHSATGDADPLAGDHRRGQRVQPLPGVPWLRIPLSEPSSHREPV